MEVSRRRFVKMSATASAAAALGFGVRSAEAAAMSASIASLIIVDPVTLEYKIFGPCCHFCPDHLIVSHYQPVALVEVIKGGGDSVIGQPVGGPFSVGTDRNSYTTMAVRIWQLPDWAIDVAMGGQSCKLCGVKAARRHNISLSSKFDMCGAAANPVVSKAVSAFNGALPNCFPKLLYSTEFDPTWNTGCRDIVAAESIAGVVCNPLTGSFSVPGMEVCIGQWGGLYPRQMASHNDNASIAAGIAAYRAIHLSGFTIGTFPFSAALSVGKLQQTKPWPTVGFKAGSKLLDSAMRLYPVSLEEMYAFVWWTPVVCCKDYEDIMGWCTPKICSV